jgi:hypothetical protein
MLYAIISPNRAIPWGYFDSERIPTLEELADHMANVSGYADRDEWVMANGYPFIGYAPVQ